MTKGVAEAVGREKGRGKGRVGRGLRECLRQTIQVKDEMLAPLNESSVFMAWRLTIRNRTWGFGSEGLGSRGLEIGLRSGDLRTFGTYHIIHQPITPNNDNVTLLTGTSNRIASFMGSSLLCVPTYIHIRVDFHGRTVLEQEDENEDRRKGRENQFQILVLFE